MGWGARRLITALCTGALALLPALALAGPLADALLRSDNFKVRLKAATELARKKAKELGLPMEIEGELQVDAALDPIVASSKKIEGTVAGRANVLIFPTLEAGNVAYKLMRELGGVPAVGPVLLGMRRSVTASSFTASLELAREGLLELRQEGPFRPIYLRRRASAA